MRGIALRDFSDRETRRDRWAAEGRGEGRRQALAPIIAARRSKVASLIEFPAGSGPPSVCRRESSSARLPLPSLPLVGRYGQPSGGRGAARLDRARSIRGESRGVHRRVRSVPPPPQVCRAFKPRTNATKNDHVRGGLEVQGRQCRFVRARATKEALASGNKRGADP